MKAASLKELKSELEMRSPIEVLDICMRLVKYKKENKELLTYLLFNANDENSYIEEIKAMMTEQLDVINMSNAYLIKKSLRKTIRTVNKFIKYSGSKQTEVELLIFLCKEIIKREIPLRHNKALENIYVRLKERILKSIATLHEDLQYDFTIEMNSLKDQD
jgi:hypothetical protein